MIEPVDKDSFFLRRNLDLFFEKNTKKNTLSRYVLQHYPELLSTFTPSDLTQEELIAYRNLARVRAYYKQHTAMGKWTLYCLERWEVKTFLYSLIFILRMGVAVGVLLPIAVIQVLTTDVFPGVEALCQETTDSVRATLDALTRPIQQKYSTPTQVNTYVHLFATQARLEV